MSLHEEPLGELSRLGGEWYQGKAWVHWTMTICDRRHGWLDERMHGRVREILIHACARHRMLCPAYCLMPDHGHFLFMGLCRSTNQLNALKMIRRAWNAVLHESGCELQKQAYDHVLVQHERDSGSFENALYYIFENPERAELAKAWRDWECLGSIAAGYPDFDARAESAVFRSQMWKIHHLEVGRFEREDL